MSDDKKAMLMQHGIDVDEVMNRLMGKEELIKKFLFKFPKEECYARLRQSIADKDYKAAFEHSHNLKGITANLSMTALNQKTSTLVENLRAEAYDKTEDDFEQVAKAYDMVIKGIENLSNLYTKDVYNK